METRYDWKSRGKRAMYRNYWKYVLAAFLISLSLLYTEYNSSSSVQNESYSYSAEFGSYGFRFRSSNPFAELPPGAAAAAGTVGTLFLLLQIFLFLPLEVSGRRFMVVGQSRQGDAELSEIPYPFQTDYLNVVKTQFLRRLFTFLWTLLFIIPGIVKTYAYRMVPYILAEQPDMDSMEAIRLSQEMMEGHKWEAFGLDLSFLLWQLLSAFTMNILGLFFVNPYYHATCTEYYVYVRDLYLGRSRTSR